MALNDYLRTSSLDIYDSVSYKNLEERDRYNRLLLGKATRAEVGQDLEANNPTARPPSWTQHAAGLSHGFVISALSASEHERQVLNARKSGTVALEHSPVPASGTEYYTKSSRMRTVTYKVTGSMALDGISSVSSVSGALIANVSTVAPFVVPFDVVERGKIVDVKVWVELVTESGSEGVLGNLSCIGLALRSPNVHFHSSYPIMNDKTLVRTGHFDEMFFRNTYLLWVGSQLDDAVLTVQTTADDHYTWGKDRHMRTIFSDSAHPLDGYNPRNIASSHGGFFVTHTASSAVQNYATNSPNGVKTEGNDWPWISDERIQEGGNHGAAGSPPAGWLTGPAKTAAVNEWPTTGSNYGPTVMQPMYPLLDTILEEKCIESITREKTYDYSGDPTFNDSRISTRRGIRPGLRGTQSQGHWELLIATKDSFSAVAVHPCYFRQARLELTIDTGETTSRVLPRKRGIENRKFPKPISIVSGSFLGVARPDVFGFATNKFRNIVYMMPDHEIGATIGITDDSGSTIANDFAVFTRIVGPLAARYSGSNMAQARYRFLNNEFGTPYIPLSSGSGAEISSQVTSPASSSFSSEIFEILNPRTSVSTVSTLRDALNTTRPSIQTRDRVSQITSGSA